MGRPKDKWWDHAKQEGDGFLCNYCGKRFKGGVSRIKLHLSCRGGNIGPCQSVPREIKEKAKEELQGGTSVGESSREKAVKASSMKPIRYASVGEDSTGGNVAETGEMSSLAAMATAMATSSHNQVPKELKGKAGEERLRGDISVGEGNRDKALKPSPIKRARYTSVGEDGHGVNVAETGEMSSLAAMPISSHNQVPSSSSFCGNPSDVAELVKFLISRNVAVDVFKDSHFWRLLTNVQSWVQLLDNSAIIEKSLSNFELEMNQYMLWVKESWKTTGCTLILYDLSEVNGKFPADDRYNLVAGFYCPKGFIFVEVDLPMELNMCCSFSELDNALKNHHLNLSTDDVVQILDHRSCYKYECQYQEYGLHDLSLGCCWRGCDSNRRSKIVRCFRDYVIDVWKNMCEGSDCLRKLIEKADKLYWHILLDLPHYDEKLRRTLKLNSVKQAAEGNFATSLYLFRSIMDLRGEIMRFLETDNRAAAHFYELCIPEITKDDEFWRDVEDVVKALTPILQIVDLMDTLLPTGAYFLEALDEAGGVLRSSLNRERKPEKFVGICNAFGCLQRSTRYTDDLVGISRCLNPLDCINKAPWGDHFFDGMDMLERLINEEERERLEDEASRYKDKCSNPFANISSSEYNVYHPVKLWDKYGSDFPVLHKCATKILNQPVTCLCKQVEKCMSQLRGSDNLILRLNAMMKEEFDKLGNEMYQPVDVDSIFLKSTRNR